MDQDNRLTTVFRTTNQIEAELIKGMLESSGIPALLKYESLGQVYGLTIDGLGQVDVQVPNKFIKDAENLINYQPDDGSQDR
jgi:hypothetical protein